MSSLCAFLTIITGQGRHICLTCFPCKTIHCCSSLVQRCLFIFALSLPEAKRGAVFDLWLSPQCCCGFVSVLPMTKMQGRNVLLSQKSPRAVRHLLKPAFPASHFLCLGRIASCTCRALLSAAVALFSLFKQSSFFPGIGEEKAFTKDAFFCLDFAPCP